MLLVHLAVADIVNDAHGFRLWSTVKGLAEKAAVAERTVASALAELVELGIMEVLKDGGGRGKPTEYRYLGNHATVAPFPVETLQPTTETLQPSAPHPLINTKEHNNVDLVFTAWTEAAGRTGRTRLDAKRRKLIVKALAAYPFEEILAAVRGWKNSPYHRGENESKKVYNELGLLLRDAEHIERFRDLAGPTATPVNPKVRHHDDGTVERFYEGTGWVRG